MAIIYVISMKLELRLIRMKGKIDIFSLDVLSYFATDIERGIQIFWTVNRTAVSQWKIVRSVVAIFLAASQQEVLQFTFSRRRSRFRFTQIFSIFQYFHHIKHV